MTDIPGATASTYTLTSADIGQNIAVKVTATNTAGNASATAAAVGPIAAAVTYATWDAATITAVTLSGGNLVATSTGNGGAKVAAASGKTTGKYYFEITLTTNGGSNSTVGAGITTATYANMSSGAGLGGVISFVGSNGNIYSNGVSAVLSISAPSSGNIIGVAIDLDNRKAWFRVAPSGNWNGQVIGSQNPATTTGGVTIVAGTIIPFACMSASGPVYTANFGASAFSGAVPSGFTAGWPA